eukprot:3305010-Rhodomonas_salina.2
MLSLALALWPSASSGPAPTSTTTSLPVSPRRSAARSHRKAGPRVDAPPHEAGRPTAGQVEAKVQARALEKKLSRKRDVLPASLLHGSSRTGARQLHPPPA